MKKFLLFLIILTFFLGCAHSLGEMVCRHEATVCALVAGEKYPVRIVLGHSKKYSGISQHAQAQAYVNGKWEWLHLCGDDVLIVEKDNHFDAFNYWGISDFLNKYMITPEMSK